jgi:hypothetical protein
MTDIAQVRAALEEIGKLIDLLDCADKHNLALLPLFLVEQKRARAALARMEPALIRAAALEEAAQRIEADEEDYLVRNEVAAAIRALKPASPSPSADSA